MTTPYSALPPERFWRSGVASAHPSTLKNLYAKKFEITLEDKIATAGSCFAQHVARHMRGRGFQILDAEPPPFTIDDATAKRFGYRIYSGRYGNIYTARQLRQLLVDSRKKAVRDEDVWEKDGRFFDGLRPNVEPEGLETPDEVKAHRLQHLAKVGDMFASADVLVFTLGLTEAWENRRTGTIHPICPGVVAGTYDEKLYAFKNFDFLEIYEDMKAVRQMLLAKNPKLRMLLTVSPVPLTATASDDHVLVATTYSKSVLRAVCGSLSKEFDNVDYFPSYELITAPLSRGFFYEPNMREVTEIGVSTVMETFFAAHDARRAPVRKAGAARRALGKGNGAKANGAGAATNGAVPPGQAARAERQALKKARRKASGEGVVCEEVLLDAFAKR